MVTPSLTPVRRPCPTCNRLFSASTTKQAYCSTRCRVKNWRDSQKPAPAPIAAPARRLYRERLADRLLPISPATAPATWQSNPLLGEKQDELGRLEQYCNDLTRQRKAVLQRITWLRQGGTTTGYTAGIGCIAGVLLAGWIIADRWYDPDDNRPRIVVQAVIAVVLLTAAGVAVGVLLGPALYRQREYARNEVIQLGQHETRLREQIDQAQARITGCRSQLLLLKQYIPVLSVHAPAPPDQPIHGTPSGMRPPQEGPAPGGSGSE